LDDFDLLCVLGRGSFGKVMKVRKKDTKEIFAMKILSKEMLIKQNMISYTKTEKNILQSVDHPFIVSLKFAFQTEAKLYLVLTYLSGGELFFHLSNEVKFTIDRTRFYAAELVLAIGHLHSMDIIYRDLKPENVVLDSQGHVQVTDFGLAKKEINSENPTSTFCGTPEVTFLFLNFLVLGT
jgi:serum/glucocorticoid-regulated kinase 2